MGWHPDTDFAEYVNGETGERLFDDGQAAELNRQLDQSIDILGDRIYEHSLDLFHQRFGEPSVV